MKVRAYHFVGATLRDGSPIPPDGEWLEFSGQRIMCKSGLHASRHPLDALQYAPGATLCLVDCDGIAEEQNDKLVCSRRRIVARIDATELLWGMARWSALQVLHLWNAPQVVRDYLATGNESLRDAAGYASGYAGDTAWYAARAAAWAAARDEAWYKAWYAARAAAQDEVGDEARDVAWYAAWSATRDAAWAAARAAQKTKFLALVTTAFAERGIEI